jgi:four helix bundle protein
MEVNNVIKVKSFLFAISIIKYYKYLVDEKKEFVLSKILLRSGTSTGANVREAINAESRADFIQKRAITQKECDETLYWNELLTCSGIVKSQDALGPHENAEELLRIIRSIILTTKQKIIHNSNQTVSN